MITDSRTDACNAGLKLFEVDGKSVAAHMPELLHEVGNSSDGLVGKA